MKPNETGGSEWLEVRAFSGQGRFRLRYRLPFVQVELERRRMDAYGMSLEDARNELIRMDFRVESSDITDLGLIKDRFEQLLSGTGEVAQDEEFSIIPGLSVALQRSHERMVKTVGTSVFIFVCDRLTFVEFLLKVGVGSVGDDPFGDGPVSW